MAEKSNYINKNDLMFFQNEVFFDLKNMETSFNSKLTKLNENLTNIEKEYSQKFDYFSNKIKDIVEKFSLENLDHEKVEELYRNKDRIKDELTQSKTRFLQFQRQINASIYKYDRAIIDNLEVPGLIGYNCKYNNLRQFLDFLNIEINSLKTFKSKQIGEMEIIKDKFEKLSQRLDISNKDAFQRLDLIYNNKVESLRKEIEKQFEMFKESKFGIEPAIKNSEFSKIEMEIKNNQDLSNQIKEEMKNEINEINNEIKKNKEIIDANYTIINKQKQDLILLKEQIQNISEDVENLKIQKNEEIIEINEIKTNQNNLINNMNLKIIDNKDNNKKNNIKNQNQKISSTSELFNSNTVNKFLSKKKNKRKFNEDIQYFISKDKKMKRMLSNIHVKKENIKKRPKTSLLPKINHKTNFLFNENEEKEEKNIIKKTKKKFLTYCLKSNLKLEVNYFSRNLKNNILNLSYNSFSSSSDREKKKKDEQKKMKKEKLINEFINEQINRNLSKNIEINRKINKNVSKLLKLKPIEKPIKLNLKNSNEKINLNQENSNINKIDIKKTNSITFKAKDKTNNFPINMNNRTKIQNKNNTTVNNINKTNNEVNHCHLNLNLTEKEILRNIVNNIENKGNNIKSISNALTISSIKKDLFSLNKNAESIKINPIISDTDENKERINNLSKKNSTDEKNNSEYESNKYIRSHYITSHNLYSLHRNNSNFENKTNNKEESLLNGFLTSIPIKSDKQNGQEEDEKIEIKKKIKKMNYKLNKINSNAKIIINRLNLLELNYKPLNSQINDILTILLFIYEYIKKRNTNNKLSNYIFNDRNNKSLSKAIKYRRQNPLLSIRTKNYLFTTNRFNLDEGFLYSSEQTKEELDIILKKIEPFLIKQFKGTI